MRPVHIVLLVLAGALAGVMLMKVVQTPHPVADAALSTEADRQVAAVPAEPAPAPAPPEAAKPSTPAAAPPIAAAPQVAAALPVAAAPQVDPLPVTQAPAVARAVPARRPSRTVHPNWKPVMPPVSPAMRRVAAAQPVPVLLA